MAGCVISSSENAAEIAHADVIADRLKRAAEQSLEAQRYNRGMKKYAKIIETVIKAGTLAEKVDVERTLLDRDLLSAADDPKLLKEAEEAIVNFAAGMAVYDRLTTEPAEYRKYAAGFMPKHLLPGDIPKDEMHHVLKSQQSREAQRDASRHNTPGEEALVKVRTALLASIISDYRQVQEIVLDGGDPPEGAARGA